MDVDPPSAMTRFGMFFLAGGVALILAMWGALKWLDQPRTATKMPTAASPQATQTR